MSTESPNPAPLRVRVFLASPGDVADERALALKTLESLQYDPFLRGRIHVETVAWDKPGADTPMLATLTPQEAIEQQRPKPSECDIVIVIFWSRMGTPLPSDYKKSDGSGYLSGTEWESLDAFEAAQKTGRPRVLVYRRTEEPRIGLNDPQFREKQDQWQLVNTFFDSFRNPDGSIRSGINEYDTPDTFEKKLTEHLKEIVKTLLDEHRAASPAAVAETVSDAAPPPEQAEAPPLWEGSPFPGLRAFGEDDAPIYFGRGRETDGLVRRVAEGARFITVVGASGSGKSSLVAAGLLPRLKDNAIPGSRDWVKVRLTPGEMGEDPFVALAAGFKSVLDRHGRKVRDEAKKLATDPAALDELVALALEGKHEWSEVLLFVDQFEELFTVVDTKHRGAFAALLAHSATLPRLRTVVTLRADFYHRCVEYPVLAQLLRTDSYPLAAPGVGALYEMITRPAARAGLSFEQELPERILDDTGGEPGALPLMAFALERLYDTRGDTGQLAHAAYETFGGVKGAISQRAEATFGTLDAAARASFNTVFRELVEVESAEDGWVATRRRAPLAQAAPTTDGQRLVDRFTDARLLRQSKGEDDVPVVEVAHEALLHNWPRMAEWIENTGRDLAGLRQIQRAAEEWQAQRRRGDLRWPRRRWKAAEGLLERLQVVAEEPVKSFLAASRSRTRKLAGAFVVAPLIAVGLLGTTTLYVAHTHSAHFELTGVVDQAGSPVIDYELHLIREDSPIWDVLVPASLRLRLLTPGRTYWVAVDSPHHLLWQKRVEPTEPDQRFADSAVLLPDEAVPEPEMVPLPPEGSTLEFQMGSLKGTEDETPVHTVRIARPFAIGRYEVTFDEFDVFARATGLELPDDQGWGQGRRPVIIVSWKHARDYAVWLSLQTDKGFRLPSEAEWEYATRAGTFTPYSTGDCINTDQANYNGNYGWRNCPTTGVSPVQTVEAGSLPANPWGLHEVHGNVWEWVEDCWHDGYKGAPADGSAWLEGGGGDCGQRVLRGGSWYSEPGYLRSAYRYRLNADYGSSYIGFRLAQDLDQ